jgi:protein SCO1/2
VFICEICDQSKYLGTANEFICEICEIRDMNRNAALATALALGVALLAYFIMRFFPPIEMPHRLFYDSIETRTVKGKEKEDTIWSRVPDFTLTNQLGQKISWKDLEGKVVVADFFFTHCPSICPAITRNMKKLQDVLKTSERVGNRDADYVQFLSFSVDPGRDSVPELKKFADRYQVNPQNWWLLTGDKKQIYDLAINGMKLGITEREVDTSFIHPQKFVLIDKDRVIRSRKDEYGNPKLYNGLDSNDVKDLAEDIVLLALEKDPKKKFFLAGKLELIAIVFAIAAVGLIVLFSLLKKENK